MSQFGAKAMADQGSLYSAILAHYYGASPQPSRWLAARADHRRLEVGEGEVTVFATGGAGVSARVELAAGVAVWRFSTGTAGVSTSIPQGIGTRPQIRADCPIEMTDITWRSLTSPAEVTISGTVEGRFSSPWSWV